MYLGDAYDDMGIGLFDQGFTLPQLSGAFLRLPVWDVLTGHANPSNTNIANYLWTNVYGSTPSQSQLSSAAAALDSQTGELQGQWLADLAASSANQTHVNLVGVQQTGLVFSLA